MLFLFSTFLESFFKYLWGQLLLLSKSTRYFPLYFLILAYLFLKVSFSCLQVECILSLLLRSLYDHKQEKLMWDQLTKELASIQHQSVAAHLELDSDLYYK